MNFVIRDGQWFEYIVTKHGSSSEIIQSTVVPGNQLMDTYGYGDLR